MNYYPDAPGYQRHSDTSREAAESLRGSDTLRAAMLAFIREQAEVGATIDQCAAYLTESEERMVATGTAAARMIELERAGKVSRTPLRRLTRSGRKAAVYIFGSWAERLPEPPNYPPPPRESQLERYRLQLQKFGHGHFIDRLDGRREGCGGTAVCKICKQEKSYFTLMEEKEKNDE